MNIRSILNELKFADENVKMICAVPCAGIKSRIYVVGQVQENVPGVVLGDREPYLREKTLGTFVEELKTFGPSFQENDFLMESDHELSDDEYEIRYYKVTSIKVLNGEIVLCSEDGEIRALREIHQEPECE